MSLPVAGVESAQNPLCIYDTVLLDILLGWDYKAHESLGNLSYTFLHG
jgi:hypothetical protein